MKGDSFLIQSMDIVYLVSAISEDKQGFNWTWDKDFEINQTLNVLMQEATLISYLFGFLVILK